MSEVFNAGDKVRLKSGGPYMTVEKVEGEDILCVWFEDNKAERQTFLSVTLKRNSLGLAHSVVHTRK